jgi:hypothetical protein
MAKKPAKRWSQRVTKNSDALDLEPNVFTKESPGEVAASLKRSAEASPRRKASAFQSAMSMLAFYINRAGHGLTASRRHELEDAKRKLRGLFGKPQVAPKRVLRKPAKKKK